MFIFSPKPWEAGMTLEYSEADASFALRQTLLLWLMLACQNFTSRNVLNLYFNALF